MKRITQNINNIPVYLYQTDKFKTINIRFVFKNHYTKENATKYSLLTSIMSNTSKKYNTKRKVNNALDNLYSGNIIFSTYSIHKTRITTVNLTLVNERYLDEEILKKGIELLKEFLLFPNQEDGIFDLKVFEEEKNLLEEGLKRIFNNKHKYAINQMIKNMCSNEIVNVSSNGSLEDLPSIKIEDIYDTYCDLLYNSEKEIYIIGDVEFDYITKILENKILKKLTQCHLHLDSILLEDKNVNDIKTIIENAETNQTQLVIGYRTSIGPLDQDYHTFKIFVAMFGGVYSSNLNKVIREEHSYAYSIYASYLSRAKVMYVAAGIDAKNCEEVFKLINIELKKYQNGEISPELLLSTKAELLDGLKSFEDSPGGILNAFIDVNTIFKGIKEFKTSKEYCDYLKDKITNVTVDDIKRVSNTIKTDTIYRLQNQNYLK